MKAARQRLTPEASDEPDARGSENRTQAGKRDSAFAERVVSLLRGRNEAEVARKTGVGKSTVAGWKEGAVPSAITFFRLADFVGVDPRWLATGEGRQERSPLTQGESDEDWTLLPRYDLYGISEHGKGTPAEEVAVRRDWLGRLRVTAGLWIAEMPTDALPEVAKEGDQLICQDAKPPLAEGQPYVLLLHGRPMVRRVELRPAGMVLKASDPTLDPINLSRDEVEAGDVVPIGRVVGALALRAV